MVLDNGMVPHEVSISMKDAQFLEMSQWSTEDISRIYRVPLHMLNDLRRATNGNAEALRKDFVQYTMTPHIMNWQSELHFKLQMPQDELLRFQTSAFTRGDSEAVSKFFNSGLQNGYYTINEVREELGLNPIEGGDTVHIQVNMATLENVNSGEAQNTTQQGPGDGTRDTDSVNQEESVQRVPDSVLSDAARRIAGAEFNKLQTRAGKADEDRQRFNNWACDWVDKKHEKYVESVLKPIGMNSLNSVVCASLKLHITGAGDPQAKLETLKEDREKSITEYMQAFQASTGEDNEMLP